jgi:hypothetical protein
LLFVPNELFADKYLPIDKRGAVAERVDEARDADVPVVRVPLPIRTEPARAAVTADFDVFDACVADDVPVYVPAPPNVRTVAANDGVINDAHTNPITDAETSLNSFFISSLHLVTLYHIF